MAKARKRIRGWKGGVLNLSALKLPEDDLTQLLPEIAAPAGLQDLKLSANQLSSLPLRSAAPR